MREETTTVENRPRGTISKPIRFGYDDFVCLAVNTINDVYSSELKNYEQIMESVETNGWMLAMNEKMQSL